MSILEEQAQEIRLTVAELLLEDANGAHFQGVLLADRVKELAERIAADAFARHCASACAAGFDPFDVEVMR